MFMRELSSYNKIEIITHIVYDGVLLCEILNDNYIPSDYEEQMSIGKTNADRCNLLL